MHPKYRETANQILAWAQAEEDIHGIAIIGSQARSTLVSDQWSDLDLMVLTGHPQLWMADNAWFDRFGDVVTFFDEMVHLHFTNWNWCVKRVLYSDFRDIDFSILPYDHLDEVLSVNEDILSKGYQVIYDSAPGLLESKIRALLERRKPAGAHLPAREEVDAVVRDLLFHVIWAMKKIKRGELWVATGCINSYMRGLLLQLVDAHNAAANRQPDILQYNGRFLDQRSDPEVLAGLARCFTRYDADEAVEALQHVIDFTAMVVKSIYAQSGEPYDMRRFEEIQKMVDAMKIQ
jgi:aminoglycoside 6-adenylyltransferase